MSEFEICSTCGGEYDKRFLDTPCPECGKQYGGKDATKLETPKNTQFLEVVEHLDIPKEYLTNTWSKSKLLKDNANKLADRNFQRFGEQLDKAHTIFANGMIPRTSAIIIAPPKMSKEVWAYSCMQMAVANNHTVTWLLDTQEVNRLLVLSGDNPKYKLYNKISYDDYMMADVCFVTVTKTQAKHGAYQVILELLDRRSRKGLPTFIISRYDLKQISRWDYDNQFEHIRDYSGKENNLKYPAIIQWMDIFNKDAGSPSK